MTQHLHAARVPGCYRCDLREMIAQAIGTQIEDFYGERHAAADAVLALPAIQRLIAATCHGDHP